MFAIFPAGSSFQLSRIYLFPTVAAVNLARMGACGRREAAGGGNSPVRKRSESRVCLGGRDLGIKWSGLSAGVMGVGSRGCCELRHAGWEERGEGKRRMAGQPIRALLGQVVQACLCAAGC